jgi:hypothetical protein
MSEVTSLVLLLVILFVIVGVLNLSGARGYSWPASATDPFEGRHIHIISRQEDIDRLPCDVPTCRFYGWQR